MSRHEWAIVLAAGDGTRLSELTARAGGGTVPKQFCTFAHATLLHRALARATRTVGADRVVTVVAEAHRGYWEPQLRPWPRVRAVAQPLNRGTAPGLLLPLQAVAAADPDAVVLVVPADHFVADERALRRCARLALARAAETAAIVVLGIEPDQPDGDYGWIEPGRPLVPGVAEVSGFVEKPDAATAARLLQRGALWSSFLLAAPARVLQAAYAERLPGLLRGMAGVAIGPQVSPRLAALYRDLPASDVSRDLLQRAAGMQVVRVPPCGWSDLGTVTRVLDCARALGWPRSAPGASLDLVAAAESATAGKPRRHHGHPMERALQRGNGAA